MAGSGNPPDRPGGAAPSAQDADRLRRLDERERHADERDVLADERDVLAGARDALADARDTLASERETAADERDRAADERDAGASQGRNWLGEQARFSAVAGAGQLQQRILATIERTRAVLAADQRPVAATAPGRPGEPPAQGGPPLTGQRPPPAQRLTEVIDRGKAVRGQALAAIAAFAAIEEQIADQHDDLAARHPGKASEHQGVARQARANARRARAITRGCA